MHDLDRQQLEQFEDEALTGESQHFVGGTLGEASSPLSESQELELAAELLEIGSEQELEEFLGSLAGYIARTYRGAVNSPAMKAAKPVLKSTAKNVIPAVAGTGTAIAFPGHPFLGPMVTAGTKVLLDQLLKEELEGLSGEDREFEIARRYVRFATEALRSAARAPRRVPPVRGAQVALTDSARKHIPGMVPLLSQTVWVSRRGRGFSANGTQPGGRWVRRGNTVVIDLG